MKNIKAFYLIAFAILFTIFFGVKLLFYILVPVFLIWYFFIIWFRYSKLNYWSRQDSKLFKIILGSDLTARNMELVLSSLYKEDRDIGVFKKYIMGEVKKSHSIEIVSDNNKLSFYIRTLNPDFASMIKSFAPNAEISEVQDYTYNITDNVESAEFSSNLPFKYLPELLTKGGKTWSQFIVSPTGPGEFECGIRVLYFTNNGRFNLLNKYKNRDYFVHKKNGFKISARELSNLFIIPPGEKINSPPTNLPI